MRWLRYWERAFFPLMIGLLAVTSILKIISLSVGSKLLSARDPVFQFATVGDMQLAAAVVEIGVIIVMLLPRVARFTKLAVLCALSATFLSYRLGLYLLDGSDTPCPCLGSLTEWVPYVTEPMIASASAATFGFLLIGSYGTFLVEWYRNAHKEKAFV